MSLKGSLMAEEGSLNLSKIYLPLKYFLMEMLLVLFVPMNMS